MLDRPPRFGGLYTSHIALTCAEPELLLFYALNARDYAWNDLSTPAALNRAYISPVYDS